MKNIRDVAQSGSALHWGVSRVFSKRSFVRERTPLIYDEGQGKVGTTTPSEV
ncbi:MAG: hypothetical protein HOO01_04605 [Cellvibrionales bacterium]|nr:hypothetical protein [Cellvibrionales bacterium]